MSNVNAAIGLVQMKYIDQILARRRELAERYKEKLQDVVSFPLVTEGGTHTWQTFCVFVGSATNVKEKLTTKGIETQIGTFCLTSQLPSTQWAMEHVLALPLFYEMTEEQQDKVVEELKNVIT